MIEALKKEKAQANVKVPLLGLFARFDSEVGATKSACPPSVEFPICSDDREL
jgi:hypothetical protein